MLSQPKNLPPHYLVSKLEAFLCQHLGPAQPAASIPRLLLALSGGLDSCVLLHLLKKVQDTYPFDLYAMHVHHGLSSNADAWASFCEQLCATLQVPLQVVHVHVNKSSKQGIEATARQLRYQALDEFLIHDRPPDFIVTAHHQDDQAETLLLQLFRGAGVKGLSSMAPIDVTRKLLRPLLDVSRQVLNEYAVQQNLVWCEDESNDDTQYERNFLRHEVMPVLEARFQSVKSVLARTASHLAEANQLLESMAALDAETLLVDSSLCLKGLAQLSLPRAKNLLRWWFLKNKLAMPAAEHLAQIIQQLLHAKTDADLLIQLQHLTLRRYQQRAYLCPQYSVEAYDRVWTGEPCITLPGGGLLRFNEVVGHGLALKQGMTKLRITNRSGGERFKPNALRPTRTLKYLLQEANVPPWQRAMLPLIYWDDTLAYVPGIGVAHELQAAEGEVGLEVTWHEALLSA